MPLPKTILVPTDFGDASEAALDQALDFARAFGAEVVLLHAFEVPVVGFPDGAIFATTEIADRILEGARIGLDRQIEQREGAGVTIRGVIRQGDAHRVILDVAKEVGAGLVTLGTHGRKGLSRVLLGSVAEKVVRSSSVPVMTVHACERGRRVADITSRAAVDGRAVAAADGGTLKDVEAHPPSR